MASDETNNFEAGDVVIVIGGKLDSTGVIETSVITATVVEVGHGDLMVTVGATSQLIVPKSLCLKVHNDESVLLSNQIVHPAIGDMIFYKGKVSWRDKEPSTIAGTVYEISIKDGKPYTATVHTGSDMVELPYNQLLVLQRKA